MAGYQLHQDFTVGGTSQALIPLPRTFQLDPSGTTEGLLRKVLWEVAQAFIRHHDELKRHGISVPDIERVKDWIATAAHKGTGGGINVLGSGLNANRETSVNTSEGFAGSGLPALMRQWLAEAFPSRANGGFIGVVDNMELLETSKAARAMLEAMRDEVLGLDGVSWVLCGARGIMRTSASSPRMEGRLSEPLDLLSYPRRCRTPGDHSPNRSVPPASGR